MLLALDVGNTQTVVGLFDDRPLTGQGPVPGPARGAGGQPGRRDWRRAEEGLAESWRLATVAERTADELALTIRELLSLAGRPSDVVSGVAVSSSVPAVTRTVEAMVERWFDVPLVVASVESAGLASQYAPGDIGPDRLVDAVGALDLCDGPLVVVDLGTATSFNAVSAEGEYLGGALLPGIAISMGALFSHAAALRRVDLVAPARVVGRSTVESVQSGAVFGYASLVDGMCRRIQGEIGEATVLATGGLAPVVVAHCEEVDHHEPWLTLHGLRLVFRRARERAAGVTP